MAELHNPHDRLFRALLSDRERVRDLLRDHLPNSITGQLADTLPEIIEGSFVDEALAGSQSDLLLKVELAAGGEAFVYVLAEHKSTPDPDLPLQLASYMVRIWKRHAGTSAQGRRCLPAIIPMVVYHGADRWSVPDGLADMIDTDDRALALLPGEGYILRNLRELEIQTLSRNAGLQAGFVTLRQETLSVLAGTIASLPEGGDLRRQLLEYVLQVYNVTQDELQTTLHEAGYHDLEALVGTIAETLLEQGEARGLAKGEARGLAKGEARGLAKGRVEGKAEILTRLLERRFGPLPGDIRHRIATAGVAQVDTWLDAVIDAPDMAAIFGARE